MSSIYKVSSVCRILESVLNLSLCLVLCGLD